MTRRLAALAVAAVLVAGACGGDDGGGGDGGEAAGDDEVTTTTTAAAETTTTASTAPAPAGGPTEAQLEQALLTVDDLPDGYETTRTSDEDDTESAACIQVDVDDAHPPAAQAERQWQHRQAGGFASHQVSAYGPGVAAEAFALGVDQLNGCAEFTVEEDGQTITGTMRPLEIPALGDESAGFDMQASIGDVEVAGHIVALRAGDVVSVLTRVAIASQPDKAVTDALIQRAFDKLAALA